MPRASGRLDDARGVYLGDARRSDSAKKTESRPPCRLTKLYGDAENVKKYSIIYHSRTAGGLFLRLVPYVRSTSRTRESLGEGLLQALRRLEDVIPVPERGGADEAVAGGAETRAGRDDDVALLERSWSSIGHSTVNLE